MSENYKHRVVSKQEIQELFGFTRKHYVAYYDLQTELVDHLANGIEEQWKTNSYISFEDALQVEFKKFGIFGFSDIIEQRQKVLSKRYYKMVGKEMLTFFKVPRIILSLGSMYLIYWLLMHFSYGFEFVMGVTVLMAIIALVLMIRNKKNRTEKKKKFLLEEIIFNYGGAFAVVHVPFNFLNIYFNRIDDNGVVVFYYALIISITLVLLYVYGFICFFYIPKRAHKYLTQVYPEYNKFE
ncbi:hypothetical protein NBRC110019_19150 [Neptunitalea chrysea]|uniref:Uncharacterized protein n=1 Tax=Neptunitalea chrysea TaxID=1647581 RepID=A0A9W6B7A4_9FLAO|nr:hypothetical protein [Neptunitalea chrysea]GLB52875.1 hypothetical protein NBRC110019_19150 [Neptunitalea chrysea]